VNFGKNIRTFRRYQQITNAFMKNGFGYLAKDLGLPKLFPFRQSEGSERERRKIGVRIRLFLEQLGPTFVKLGQIASMRPDFIPADIIAELERLQDDVAPFSFEDAVRIVEDELGAPLPELFASFDDQPIAAASIGQVYRAKLMGGTAVAVKVQRPGISQQINTDLDILSNLARLAEAKLEWAKRYRVRNIVEEISRALRTELDYQMEARNTERFAAAARRWEHDIRIPSIYGAFTSKRVLTMEFIEGIKLSEHERLAANGFEKKEIAKRFTATILQQVLFDGFFHGDPHPGNVLALPDGNLALLDFGMVGRLSPEMKDHFASFVVALRSQNTNRVIRAVNKLGIIPDDVDRAALRMDIEALRDKYYDVPLYKVSMGEAVRDFFRVTLRHNISVPSDLTLLGKTLLTMEGVVKTLAPDFSVFDIAEPFGKRLLLERLDPLRASGRLLNQLPEYADILEDVPLRFKDLLSIVKKGKIGFEFSIQDQENFTRKLDRVGNRLSFSIILLAFSIIMVGLIVGLSMGNLQTVIWQVPIIEIGFGIASLMFLFLLYAIFRSGRF
jgi:ubiquinone biosynthesis protein